MSNLTLRKDSRSQLKGSLLELRCLAVSTERRKLEGAQKASAIEKSPRCARTTMQRFAVPPTGILHNPFGTDVRLSRSHQQENNQGPTQANSTSTPPLLLGRNSSNKKKKNQTVWWQILNKIWPKDLINT